MAWSEVKISEKALKQLERMPCYIRDKHYIWIEQVEEYGIQEIRNIRGFRDEKLKGKREGQRSIRLNRSYRAIYVEFPNGELSVITIIEVNNHEY